MATFLDNISAGPLSSQINLSRDAIQSQITDYIKNYLELENVDLTRSSFLSFMIEIISKLTGNLLFYQLSNYREFFLTKAQLPESILNLSAFLGYNSTEATPSETDLLLTFPLTFTENDVTFTIKEGFSFTAGNVSFLTYYSTEINVLNNSSVTATVTNGNQTYTIPISYNTTNNTFSFIIDVKQIVRNIQEFQIDINLKDYQFTSIDISVDDNVYTTQVEIRSPGETAWKEYIEFNSLYLMSSSDYGYVSRRISDGRRLYFGNGLIGIQPEAGSTVRVTILETKGYSGNVIAGSITEGDRLYTTTLSGKNLPVNYYVTNVNPSSGGKDEESIEEIRRNSISNLTSLNRLVSESDYQNVNSIIENSPLAGNTLPLLKRSDTKVNEIQVFSILEYLDELVKTRNAYYNFDISQTYIPRQTILNIDNEDYYTLFDINVDLINQNADYTYIMSELNLIPTLSTSYGVLYNLNIDYLNVYLSGSNLIFELTYNSDEIDYDELECTMIIDSNGTSYEMFNDSTSSTFTYIFSDYSTIPENNQKYFFNISKNSSNIAQYEISFIFKQVLDDFMISNVVSDSTSFEIYDIPVVSKSYYDSIDNVNFENLVLQKMFKNMTFKDYRMLTDFINIKFVNTTGKLKNMLYNEITKNPVKNFISDPPISPSLNDRYIIRNGTGIFESHEEEIVQCIDSTNITWYFYTPFLNDVLQIEDDSNNKYIYSGKKWVRPILDIPINLSLEIHPESTYSGTLSGLIDLVKSTLISTFSDRFKANSNIYLSEIINCVQNINGISNSRIISPECDIYFNFNTDDMSEEDLLKYSPDYVYFTNDSISIRVV